MTAWNYIVICLSLALLALLVVYEWKRANRARLLWRLFATVVLVAALAAIALPVTYRRRVTIGNKEGVLLTSGYDPDSVRFFMERNRGAVWMSEVDVEGMPAAGVKWIPMADIREAGLSVLHIFGDGLTREQCAELPSIPLVFHPSAMRAGIVSINWQRSLWPGETCRIQGRFYNPDRKAVKLLLTWMRTVLDSVDIRPGEDSDLELRTVPLQAGRAVYRLIALRGADTLEQVVIPVEVLPGKKLRVLVLAASPDFENRFLANWLSDGGHGVAVRTAISKGKYDHAYLNMATTAVDHLTPVLLDKFDVVIADAAELKAMSGGEYILLRKEVERRGLGLIIKADSTSGKMDKPGGRSLIRDSLGRTLVSASIYGSGKIILTNLHSTYARLLAGQKREYAALWTSVMQAAAGRDAVGERWQLTPALPVADRPVKALLRWAGNGLPQGLFEEEGDSALPVTAYLAQRPLLSFAWDGIYWPRVAGWQSVHTPQGERNWWYVWPAGDWRALHQVERMKQTKQWIAGMNNMKIEKAGRMVEEEGQAAGKGWFFLLAALCCLFLWVERKI